MCRHPSGQEQQPELSVHTRGSPLPQSHGRTYPLSCSPAGSCPLCTGTVSADGHLLWRGAGRHGPLTAKLRPPRCEHAQPYCGCVQVIMRQARPWPFASSRFKFELRLSLRLQGSCGFGALSNKNAWPFWSTVGISQSSPFYSNPLNGCGTCLQLQCNPSSSAFPELGVSCCLLPCLLSHLRQHKMGPHRYSHRVPLFTAFQLASTPIPHSAGQLHLIIAYHSSGD